MREERFPDFFIVGAPKCGTTALHEYLCQHPNIFLPEEKELYYFGKDLRFLNERRSTDSYLNLFENSLNKKVTGDSTATNLVSEQAAGEIKEANPDARIIIMLRNPVDMIHSLHSELIYNLNEPEKDLEKALALEEERKNGRSLPERLSCPVECLRYRHIGSFSSQVERYLDVFEEKVMVIFFDDFIKETALVYKQVLKHLSCADYPLPDFKKVNPNKVHRSARIKSLIKYMPQGLKQASRIIIPYKPLRKKLYFALDDMNTKPVSREPMKPELRTELTQFFRNDIEKLEKLLKKDLTVWKK